MIKMMMLKLAIALVLASLVVCDSPTLTRHTRRHLYTTTMRSELRRFFDNPIRLIFSRLNATTTQQTTTKATPMKMPTKANVTVTKSTTEATPAIVETRASTNVTVMERTAKAAPLSIENTTNATNIKAEKQAEMSPITILKETASSNASSSATSLPPAHHLTLSEMFQYNTSWVIGVAVVGTVIIVFFFGCVVVICYTRRPYRRSGKVYELEAAAKKNAKIPQVPTIHPATKTATLTRTKEVYY